LFDHPTFNLWWEPWIDVEQPSGEILALSIEQTLRDAHKIHAIYEPSPLVVVGIHRLLVAILQAIHMPQRTPHLVQIWRDGCFSAEKIATFGQRFADRFDLFVVDAPFLQTADLNQEPAKEDNAKPVGYLLQEQPAGTAVTHYNHTYDDEQTFCSPCAAKGLSVIPAFASSGGAGIKPSINGVPPIYILPGGDTLFHSLTASMLIPTFQPAKRPEDKPWWERPLPVIVSKKAEVRRVGYLHSLTFPARRVRLHPFRLTTACTRCGRQTAWGVRTMVYEMGESRPKTADWWRDPFAAYRKPKNEKEEPLPIRPVEGRALWREFAGLFLPDEKDEGGLQAFRPTVISQLEEVWREDRTVLPYKKIPFRAIGLRTDMKMKIFEWEENGYAIPPRLLTDTYAAKDVEKAIDFAISCDGIIKSTFRQYFGGSGQSDRYTVVKQQMSQEYWQRLGQKFLDHIAGYNPNANTFILFHQWLDTVIFEARQIFWETAESLPNDGPTLRKRQEGINHCRARLYAYRKKNYPKPEEVPT
jgi:CRISPR system Cascade subunit CasA